MADIVDRDCLDQERLFEEEFLLACQCEIQRLLNDKQLLFRDLSKRMKVSEARVSQMLGDEAANLTIRTIARIFRTIGEAPMLISRREYDRLAAGRDRVEPNADAAWTMVFGDVSGLAATCVQIVDGSEAELHLEAWISTDGRLARSDEWLRAEPTLACRAG